MKLKPGASGKNLFINVNGEIEELGFVPEKNDLEYSLINGHETEYDERFDAYYLMSDDGSEYYNTYRAIEDTPNNRRVPSKTKLAELAREETKALFEATYIKKDVDPDDYKFAMLIITNPALMHKFFIENDFDEQKAIQAFLKKTWPEI